MKRISIFCLYCSIICVPLLIPFVDTIGEFFGFKLFFLVVGIFFGLFHRWKFPFSQTDKFILIFFFWNILTILWGDFYVPSLLIHMGFLVSYVLTYFLIRQVDLRPEFGVLVIFSVLLFETAVVHVLNDGQKSRNGAYIIGHLTVALLPFFYLPNFLSGGRNTLLPKLFSKLWYSLIDIFLFFNSGLRFFGLVLFGLAPKRPKLLLFIGTILIVLMFIATSYYRGTPIYSYLLGYRVFEPEIIVDLLMKRPMDFIFGSGIGSNFTEMDLGSKGIIMHSGAFHNYYFTLIYNSGFVSFVLFLLPIIFGFKKEIGLSAWLVGALLMISIDTHRDGVWLVFAILAVKENYRLKSKNYTQLKQYNTKVAKK
jgi:hypothetical protein